MKKVKKEKKIKKGNVVVIKRKGKIIHVQIVNEKGLRIEYPKGDEITEKNESDLTNKEREKIKTIK